MKNIGLVIGCSHNAGTDIDGTVESEYNRKHSFGAQLVKKLGYKPVNISTPAGTNSNIARNLMNWINQFYEPEHMNLFVCIGWTDSTRLEIPISEPRNDFLSFNKNSDWLDLSDRNFNRIFVNRDVLTTEDKAYQRFIIENELLLEYWSAQSVLMTQYFLKSRNIDYVMCNTMKMFSGSVHTSDWLEQHVDKDRYYEYDSNKNAGFYWKYKRMGYHNHQTKFLHHDEIPHTLFAEELYEFIKGKVKCLS